MIVVSLCVELVEEYVGLPCFRIFEALVLVEHFCLVILLVAVKRAIEIVIF